MDAYRWGIPCFFVRCKIIMTWSHSAPMTVGLQVEKEEVRLRRTVGLKKDEYQLNKKKIT